MQRCKISIINLRSIEASKECDRFIFICSGRNEGLRRQTIRPREISNEYSAIEASPKHCETPPSTPINIVQQRYPKTSKATPTMCISLIDTDSEDEGDDAHKDHIETHKQNTFAKKRKSAGNKVTTTRQQCVFRSNCTETFGSWDAMIYHGLFFHAAGIKKYFECYLCKKQFPKPCTAKRHIGAVHTGLKPFKCQKCLRCFAMKSTLNVHMIGVHSNERPFQCPRRLCSMRFKRKRTLQAHIKAVHFRLRPFKSPDPSSSKSFFEKAHVKIHIRNVHWGLKPFKCPDRLCLKSVARKSEMERHAVLAHTGVKPFVYPNQLCSKWFPQKHYLKEHIERI